LQWNYCVQSNGSFSQEPDSLKSKRKLLTFLLDNIFAVIVATIALAVASNLITTVSKNATVYTTKDGNFQHIDFISYYMAGTLARTDEVTRHKAYDPAVQLSVYNQVIAPASIHRPIFFNYPPYSFPLMSAFSLLPLRQAYLTWDMLSLIFAVTALILAGRAAGALTLAPLVATSLLFVLSFPGSYALIDGQTTFWATGLIALSYLGLKSQKDFLTGVSTALLAIKPHFFLFMVIPLLVTALGGRRRPLIIAAITGLIMLLTGIMTMGLDQTINYPKYALAGENVDLCPMTFPERMVCLRGPASLFLSNHQSIQLGFFGFVFALAAVFLLFKKTRRLEWAYGLTIPILLSFSPHMHVYDCALLAIPACLLLPSISPSAIIGRQISAPFKIFSLLLLTYIFSSWLIMVLVPTIGKAVLPIELQSKLAVNDSACGLLSFYVFLLFDLLLIASGLWARAKIETQPEPPGEPTAVSDQKPATA
jgi:Glycosyltransferase family 87